MTIAEPVTPVYPLIGSLINPIMSLLRVTKIPNPILPLIAGIVKTFFEGEEFRDLWRVKHIVGWVGLYVYHTEVTKNEKLASTALENIVSSYKNLSKETRECADQFNVEVSNDILTVTD